MVLPVNGPRPLPAPVADANLAEQVTALALSFAITDGNGKRVVLSGDTLAALLNDRSQREDTLKELGVDPADFITLVKRAVSEQVPGLCVEVSRANPFATTFFDGVDNNVDALATSITVWSSRVLAMLRPPAPTTLSEAHRRLREDPGPSEAHKRVLAGAPAFIKEALLDTADAPAAAEHAFKLVFVAARVFKNSSKSAPSEGLVAAELKRVAGATTGSDEQWRTLAARVIRASQALGELNETKAEIVESFVADLGATTPLVSEAVATLLQQPLFRAMPAPLLKQRLDEVVRAKGVQVPGFDDETLLQSALLKTFALDLANAQMLAANADPASFVVRSKAHQIVMSAAFSQAEPTARHEILSADAKTRASLAEALPTEERAQILYFEAAAKGGLKADDFKNLAARCEILARAELTSGWLDDLIVSMAAHPMTSQDADALRAEASSADKERRALQAKLDDAHGATTATLQADYDRGVAKLRKQITDRFSPTTL